ncbi:AMP-dependent synthetase [Parafrankia colletiae]|uniref:AMP-dependent synthetase n=1 Tax=Parafrankia colletiae TaxID=573497 RepID=A0A1S1QP98_9ACTN|nr:AMP-dependent synthetase [Parafrankia colletiae]
MTAVTWPQRVDELAAIHPAAIALSTTARGGETLRWEDLAEASRRTAAGLLGLGVRPGDVVCVELPSRAAHVVCAHAAWRAGATVLPLRPDLPERERERILAAARPAVVIVDRPPAAAGEVTVDDLVPAAAAAAGAESPGGGAGGTGSEPPPAARPAWLIASGGSTGEPKLIASSQAAVLQSGGGPGTGRGGLLLGTGDHRHPVNLICSPLYHTQGFALLHHTLLADYRNIVMERFDPEQLLDLVETERVAFLALVPTMLIRLLRTPGLRERDLSSLERVVQGAGACPHWVIRAWIDLVGPERFVMGYGSSEGVCSTQIRGDEWLAHPGSVGRPLGTEVLVVGDDGAELPRGEVGELFFRPAGGAHTVRYVGRAEPRTRPGGYLSIGDLGSLDDEGYLYIADRRTDMIVSGGANVYVSEVEAVLLMHPAVADAAVVGLRDADWGRRVHGIVQLAPGLSREEFLESVRDYCKEHIAAYKVPRTFEIVDDLGRSESGKLNRRSLAEVREPGPQTEGAQATESAREGDVGVQPRRDDGRSPVQSLVEPPEPAV